MNYSEIEGLNWSTLKLVATSALLCHWRAEHPRPDTPAMMLGRAIHCMILEPYEWNSRYIVQPEDVNRRTKAGKEWVLGYEAAGIDILSPAQWETVCRVSNSVNDNRAAEDVLKDCRKEVTVVDVEPSTGVKRKGRVDAIRCDTLVDLKTTRELSRFERDAAQMIYHGQMAWYRDIAVAAGELDEYAEVYIIAAETAEPYDSAVYRVPADAIEAGRRVYTDLLDQWVFCNSAQQWPGMSPGIADLELPNWAEGVKR